MTPAEVLTLINDAEVKFVDLRFTDTIGKEQHVTVPAHTVDEDLFEEGKMFDGSSIAGWKGINESDMILMPDPASAVLDIFTTLNANSWLFPVSSSTSSSAGSLLRNRPYTPDSLPEPVQIYSDTPIKAGETRSH